ncbi:hypothetical protein EZZ81_02390 [Pseudomonas viridiflava]|uniref:Uncharacterized protein n=1 Tax=Pseudomonas viridiflava TaxID=33069 RepID=A0AA46VSP1_PSEVI|nr:hypothetical protein EZZ81_02390 [Pseudomonas viridiflava]
MGTLGGYDGSDGLRSGPRLYLTHRVCQCCCRFRADRRQAASYQTTCNPLKELDFVGADLSANTVFQAMNIRRMYWPFRGQVRSH